MTPIRGSLRSRPAATCLLAGFLTAGCGDATPTAPSPASPAPPTFVIGRAVFNLFSDEETCTPKTPGWGFATPHIGASVMVTAEGAGWVVRAESTRSGDLEMRFTPGANYATDGMVSGTFRGTAVDLFSILTFPNPAQVAASGTTPDQDAILSGGYAAPYGVFGKASGRFVYTDNQRGITTCTAGQFFLLALSPG